MKTKPKYNSESFIDDSIIHICYQTMMNNKAKFTAGHMAWLMDNQHIVSHFFKFSDENRIRNIKVSHRFICEHLRWKSMKRELKGDFKIGNDNITTMAHLYNLAPGRENFFTIKDGAVLPVPKGYEGES